MYMSNKKLCWKNTAYSALYVEMKSEDTKADYTITLGKFDSIEQACSTMESEIVGYSQLIKYESINQHAIFTDTTEEQYHFVRLTRDIQVFYYMTFDGKVFNDQDVKPDDCLNDVLKCKKLEKRGQGILFSGKNVSMYHSPYTEILELIELRRKTTTDSID